MLSPFSILLFIVLYFAALLFIGWLTSRNSTANSYFIGNKQSPWYLVAFGMIGDSLSGVTYISVPGTVGTAHFSYLQLVFGYFVGYFIISHVLLPTYYKMNLVSVYEYLQKRFGKVSQKTGSVFFILSRLLGAAGRLFLAASVIQFFVFDRMEPYRISFEWSVSIILLLMLLYTYKGGIRTLVFTDTFQSLFLVLGVVLSIAAIIYSMNISVFEAIRGVYDSKYSETFFFDWNKGNFVLKEFLGGVFIAACMTGLDQNMMQKNLSCRNLKEAQQNIFWFSVIMVFVTICFLSLGALVYQYYEFAEIPLPLNSESGRVLSDKVFPNLALNHLGAFAGMVFIIGLTAATFSSADSVLTTLTTSTYIDILEIEKRPVSSKAKSKFRILIHIGFAFLLWLVILLFNQLNQQAIINTILMVAGYTYGPLLALFFIGLFTNIQLKDSMVPIACILGPLLCYALKQYTLERPEAYQIGNELILLNGIITAICLLVFRKKSPALSQ